MDKVNWFLIFLIQSCKAVNLQPEEVTMSQFNKKYVTNASLNLTRHGPGGTSWFVDLAGEVRQQWGNNVTVHLIFYQYVNNEYHPTFINVKFKLCDLINKEPYIGGMVRRAGIVCPVSPAVYKLSNMTIKSFNDEWPFEKGRLNCEFSVTGSKEIIVAGYAIISFKKENDKKRRRH